MPLHVHQNMWFQHSGAPPHFTHMVGGHLDQRFGLIWIGRVGPNDWPASSPNQTSLDYFLWGHMKSMVYKTLVDSEEDLLVQVMAVVYVGLQGIGDRVYENVVHRCMC